MLLLDHIVFLVKDLEKSVRNFEQMGYIVSQGGKHGNGTTENTLIHFRNGTFLEILAVRKNWKNRIIRQLLNTVSLSTNFNIDLKDFDARFVGRALVCREGITDFCLKASEGLADYTAIKNRNLPLSIPLEMKRVRPGGQVLSWHIFSPYIAELPFVMTPYQPAFKPKSENLMHPNGAEGFDKVKVYVNDFENLVEKYGLLLGLMPIKKDAHSAIFGLGNGQIELISGRKNTNSGIGFLEASPLFFPKK